MERMLLRVSECAEALAISTNHLYSLIHAGSIPGTIRLGRSVRISRQGLEQLIERQNPTSAVCPTCCAVVIDKEGVINAETRRH